MPEVQQVAALPAELFFKLGGDPLRAIAHAMHACVRAQAGGVRRLAPQLAGHAHTAQGRPVAGGVRVLLPGQT